MSDQLLLTLLAIFSVIFLLLAQLRELIRQLGLTVTEWRHIRDAFSKRPQGPDESNPDQSKQPVDPDKH
jgi:hypothetical protein